MRILSTLIGHKNTRTVLLCLSIVIFTSFAARVVLAKEPSPQQLALFEAARQLAIIEETQEAADLHLSAQTRYAMAMLCAEKVGDCSFLTGTPSAE